MMAQSSSNKTDKPDLNVLAERFRTKDDHAAFNCLGEELRLHGVRILQCKYGLQLSDAEDVVQDALIQFAQGLQKKEDELISVISFWAQRIRWTAYDHLRSSKGQPRPFSSLECRVEADTVSLEEKISRLAQDCGDLEDEIFWSFVLEHINDVIENTLSDVAKRAIRLVAEGYSYSEIAAKLGRSTGHLRNVVYKSREYLALALDFRL